MKLSYAESLFEPTPPGSRGLVKGNRNEIEGKQFIGYHDEFVPDGAPAPLFRPLWWRTYRYIQLEIETKSEPLTIDDLTATAVGYPFERRAKFDSDAAGARPHPRRRLAHRPPLRARDLHGLPVLRAAPVRRRHARAVPGVAVQ